MTTFLQLRTEPANIVAAGIDDETLVQGVMLCLRPPEVIAKRVAVPTGDKPEQLHVTVVYFGNMKDIDPEKLNNLRLKLPWIAASMPQIGVGFNRVERLGPNDATVLMGDNGSLKRWREALTTVLRDYIQWTDTYAYLPHMTLGYWADLSKAPELGPFNENVTWVAEEIYLKVGAEITHYPLDNIDVTEEPFTYAAEGSPPFSLARQRAKTFLSRSEFVNHNHTPGRGHPNVGGIVAVPYDRTPNPDRIILRASHYAGTSANPGSPAHFDFVAHLASHEQATEWAKQWPKGLKLKVSGGEVGFPRKSLKPTKANEGINETAIKHYHAVIKAANKLGIEVAYDPGYPTENKANYQTRAEFEHALEHISPILTVDVSEIGRASLSVLRPLEFVNHNHTKTSAHPNAVGAVSKSTPDAKKYYYSAERNMHTGKWRGWVDFGPTATSPANITKTPDAYPTRKAALAAIKGQHPQRISATSQSVPTKTSAHPMGASVLAKVAAAQERSLKTEDPKNIVTWKTSGYISSKGETAENMFKPIMEKMSKLHSVPKDGLPQTEVHWVNLPSPEPGLGGIFEPFGSGTALHGKEPTHNPSITIWSAGAAFKGDISHGYERANFVHEFGHRVDFLAPSGFVSEGAGLHGEATKGLRTALGDFLLAATNNAHFQESRYRMRFDPEFVEYMSRPTEVWARAYTQWVVSKIDDSELSRSFKKFDLNNGSLMQWPDSTFKSQIAPAVEAVLRERGLLK